MVSVKNKENNVLRLLQIRKATWTLTLVSWVFLLVVAVGISEARRKTDLCPDYVATPGDLIAVAPMLDYTIATFDPSWFDLDHPEKAPTLFTIQTSNGLDSLADRLRLQVIIDADTTLGRNPGAPRVNAFNKISQPLTAEQIGTWMTSNQVFALDFQTGGTDFNHSDLYEIFVSSRGTPEMNLRFTFNLTCEDGGVINTVNLSVKTGDGKLRFVHTVQAVSPGTDIANSKPVSIFTLNPLFQIVSELFNNQEFVYPDGESKLEVYLYEVEQGKSPSNAMDGLEFAKFSINNQYPIPYPANLPRLDPGKTYAWRARAFLRGPTREYRFSNALYFKVDPRLGGGTYIPDQGILSDLKTIEQQVKYGDDYVKRVMAALKIILGENYEVFDLSRATKIPAKGQIRLNGRPYSLEELERLAREFHESRHSVTRLRFQ